MGETLKRWLAHLTYFLGSQPRRIRKNKFSLLLLFQLFFIFIYPLTEGSLWEWSLHVFSTFFFLGIVFLCTSNLKLVRFNLLLALLVVLIYTIDYLLYFTAMTVPIDHTIFKSVYDVFFIGFFFYLTVVLCFHMLTDKEPQIDTLAGTAAVYLMIGLSWSFVYINLNDLSPGAFAIQTVSGHFTYINWLFYSISTLVSSGYAIVSPISSYAQCLTLLESIIGALYIAIVTARIVGVPFNKME